MAQLSVDQHEGGVTVRETANHTGSTADLTVQSFNDIVSADAGSVFIGSSVGERFLNADLHLPDGLLQLHGVQFLHYSFILVSGLSILATNFTFERGVIENTLW